MITRHGSATVTLPSDREIRIERTFDAPAEVVFEAWTNPDYVPALVVRRRRSRHHVRDRPARSGGSWRYVTRTTDGLEMGWHGTYHEIVRARTAGVDGGLRGLPRGGVGQHDDADRKRRRHDDDGHRGAHEHRAPRTATSNSGMEGGLQLALDRLEDLIVDR